MYPILGRLGSFFIYSYTAVLGLGAAASLAVFAWRLGKRPFLFDLFLWCGGTAVLAGRLGFIITQWPYFNERPQEIWQIWQGGLAYHGVLLGGLFGLAFWDWQHKHIPDDQKQPLWVAMAFVLALLHLFGWTACLLEGCAYGATAPIGLLTADLPDSFGVYAVRYQTQALGIILSLLILLIAWKHPRFWLILSLTALAHLALTLVRGDTVVQLGMWRLDSLLSTLTFLISLFLLQYINYKKSLEENEALSL